MKRLLCLAGALALSGLVGCQDSSVPATTIDTSFELTDESGRAVTIDSYRGQLRLVFFGYTYCPDICPVTLHNIAAALRALGPDAARVTVLFISIDPKRDTPERLAQYTDAFHPFVIGLTGTYAQLLDVTGGFRTTFGHALPEIDDALTQQEYEAASAGDAYVPFHSSQVYLLGTDGELLDIIGYGSKPQQIEETLRTHLGSPDG
jgi:protein SCO1/2